MAVAHSILKTAPFLHKLALQAWGVKGGGGARVQGRVVFEMSA